MFVDDFVIELGVVAGYLFLEHSVVYAPQSISTILVLITHYAASNIIIYSFFFRFSM